MRKFLGKEVEIEQFFCWNGINEWYMIKDNPYAWDLNWLEPVKENNIYISQDNIIEMFGE